jgi:tetratricopeptide (TPR) repeat protein
MRNYILLYLITVSVFSFRSYAQKAKVTSAVKKYKSYAYIKAIKIYEKVAEKGYKSVDMFQKLGNSYYFNSDFSKAAKWYGELFAVTLDVDSEYYYRYAQSLKSIDQMTKQMR